MTEEEFIDFCKKKYTPFVSEAGVIVGNYMFTRDGRISLQVGNYQGENPHTIWITIAKKRTPKQMKSFLEIVL